LALLITSTKQIVSAAFSETAILPGGLAVMTPLAHRVEVAGIVEKALIALMRDSVVADDSNHTASYT